MPKNIKCKNTVTPDPVNVSRAELVTHDGRRIYVNTGEWFNWLDRNNLFYYASKPGISFRKERSKKGTMLWRGKAERNGIKVNLPLGEDIEINTARLSIYTRNVHDLIRTKTAEREAREKVTPPQPLVTVLEKLEEQPDVTEVTQTATASTEVQALVQALESIESIEPVEPTYTITGAESESDDDPVQGLLVFISKYKALRCEYELLKAENDALRAQVEAKPEPVLEQSSVLTAADSKPSEAVAPQFVQVEPLRVREELIAMVTRFVQGKFNQSQKKPADYHDVWRFLHDSARTYPQLRITPELHHDWIDQNRRKVYTTNDSLIEFVCRHEAYKHKAHHYLGLAERELFGLVGKRLYSYIQDKAAAAKG